MTCKSELPVTRNPVPGLGPANGCSAVLNHHDRCRIIINSDAI